VTYTDARTITEPSDTSRPRDHPDGGHSRDSLTDGGRELRPAGRYEWEQIIRRARLGDLIKPSIRRGKDGRPTKGGMAGLSVTGIALCLATFANDKGAEVFPGDATVAICMETTIKAVAAVRRALLDLGMIELVRGSRGRCGDEYRLTLPSDLLDRLDVLTPAQLELAAARLRDRARGRDRWGGPADHPKRTDGDDSVARVGPPDHPKNVDIGDRVGPADHPKNATDLGLGWSGGPAETGLGWSAGPTWGGPPDPRTDHYRTSTTTDHPEIDLRTAVTGPREPAAATKDQDSIGELRVGGTAAPAAERCPDHPDMRGGERDDGTPRCPVCRAAAVPRGVPVWLQDQPARDRPAAGPALAPAVNGTAAPSRGAHRRTVFTLIQGGG